MTLEVGTSLPGRRLSIETDGNTEETHLFRPLLALQFGWVGVYAANAWKNGVNSCHDDLDDLRGRDIRLSSAGTVSRWKILS